MMTRKLLWFWLVAGTILMLAAVGCFHRPVYEYRIYEEMESGLACYVGDEPPLARDGRIEINTPDGTTRFLPVERVAVKRVQIGPHQCQCGNILRTYRDECPNCGTVILLGSRTPPESVQQELVE